MVTGGNGFLGRYLTTSLRDDFSVVSVDIKKTQATSGSYDECDVSKFDDVSSCLLEHRPSAVVHLAAITGIERCRQSPYESFLVNVVGTFNVAWLCATNGIRLLFASSREVYGETRGGETDESSELRPNNLYGQTKLLAESHIEWMGNRMHLRYVILRFTNLYGPGGDAYAVAKIIKNAIEGEPLHVFGGDQTLNLIHVADAARALKICLTRSDITNETFNIGSKDTISAKELVHRIARISRSNSKEIHSPMRTGDTLLFRPNLAKASSKLGFESSIALDDGLSECIEYYRMQAREGNVKLSSPTHVGNDL
ncbi:NAD(P)-dependent oxidoreductase [Candidatus Bathyarchaeota archaeon]|jgi:UDP-glucose 4-epimerase|nr:NAD(P)-dependent oxidoreductase [Candidatus Bathyarchaeota archaeon]